MYELTFASLSVRLFCQLYVQLCEEACRLTKHTPKSSKITRRVTNQGTAGGAERRGALGRAAYNLVSEQGNRRIAREETQFNRKEEKRQPVFRGRIWNTGLFQSLVQ